jgi:hypothetical protein
MASRSAAVSIRGVRPGDVGRLQAIQLAPAELTPGLAARWAAPGVGRRNGGSERVCMRRDVPPGTRPGADAKS